MQGGRRLLGSVSLLACVGALAAGCGAKEDARPSGAALPTGATGGSSVGGSSTGGSSAGGSSGTVSVTGGSSGSSGTVSVTGGSSGSSGTVSVTGGSSGTGATSDCGGDEYEAMLVPLDLYVMLDSSGSMLEEAGSSTKWEAIQGALTTFLADPASSGIGIGLQFFPQHDPKVPQTCKLIADCGSDDNLCVRNFCKNAGPDFYLCDTNADCVVDNEDYGPCSPLTYCWSSRGATLCHNDAIECNGVAGDCVEYNLCSGDTTYACQTQGAACHDSTGQAIGTCKHNDNTTCEHTSDCSPAAYAAPAAEIATLPGAATGLSDVILGRMPDGTTPSAPALEGAVDHARTWASAHAGHSVAVVLATDGLPTECVADPTLDPTGVDEVVSEAKAGVSGSPSISTFVIGVFSKDDDTQLMAGMNLDRIAAAGGSVSAHVIDVAGDVEQEFLDALDSIRGTRLPCDFQLPTPTSGTLEKGMVNVVYAHDGQTETLYYWADQSACDATDGGWYYDDPSAPTKIIACPASCSEFQAASGGASQAQVRIQLGCTTVVK